MRYRDYNDDYYMGEPDGDAFNLNDSSNDYTLSDDAIGIEISEGERIQYGTSFSPQDGDIGDESEDVLDMPAAMRKTGNRYDPTLSTGKPVREETNEITGSMHIAEEEDIGMAYGEDEYVEE